MDSLQLEISGPRKEKRDGDSGGDRARVGRAPDSFRVHGIKQFAGCLRPPRRAISSGGRRRQWWERAWREGQLVKWEERISTPPNSVSKRGAPRQRQV